MNATDAQALVDQIKGGLDLLRDAVVALWEGQGWLALGYDSWPDLCAAEFPFRLALPREERRELVGELTAAGMSTRAIAPIIGADQRTVRRDLEASEANASVERPAKVTSLDGRERPATQPARPTPEGEQRLAEYLDADPDLRRREQARKFRQDLNRSWALQQWEPQFVAQILDDDDVVTIDHLILNLTSFRDQVQAARRTPLAVVKEMKR